MPEMHLRQPGFTNSACEAFKESKKEQFKDLPRKTGY